MMIGPRIRDIRESKNLSQGDIEKRTGLLRCYVSRVENGHTVPAIETLEKFARALEVPTYQLVYDGERAAESQLAAEGGNSKLWGGSGKDARYLHRLKGCLSRLSAAEREFVLFTLKGMLRKKKK